MIPQITLSLLLPITSVIVGLAARRAALEMLVELPDKAMLLGLLFLLSGSTTVMPAGTIDTLLQPESS